MQNYLRLTPARDAKGNLYLIDGLIQFRLGLWVAGKELASLTVNSGGAGRQSEGNLRTYSDPNSRAGSMEPIPEGQYAVGGYEFATPNSYSGSWGAGLGPVWFEITPQGKGSRGEFGIHLDANRAYAPGSAGCVVLTKLADLQTVVEWQKKYGFNTLLVDYGLGTVDKPVTQATTQAPAKPSPPVVLPVESVTDFKLDVNDQGLVLTLAKGLAAGQYQLFSNSPSWSGKLRGRS